MRVVILMYLFAPYKLILPVFGVKCKNVRSLFAVLSSRAYIMVPWVVSKMRAWTILCVNISTSEPTPKENKKI